MGVRASFLLFFTCVALIFIPVSKSQSSNGAIAGAIVDKSGAGIAGASVQATSIDRGGEPRVIETDSTGSYRMEALLPGTYSVLVKKAGFGDLKISDVAVKASLTTTVNGSLDIA